MTGLPQPSCSPTTASLNPKPTVWTEAKDRQRPSLFPQHLAQCLAQNSSRSEHLLNEWINEKMMDLGTDQGDKSSVAIIQGDLGKS